jgi:Uncharacterised protein family (UPF0158)
MSEPTERPLREVPVDWEALEDAFENNAPEVHSYLHLATGEVLRVVDGIADPQMHVRIASDAQYLRIDPVSSREQYRWMERFIPLVEIDELKDKLYVAIDGKGAFRRFKDILMAYSTERERWFNFRSEKLKTFMIAWLEAHGIKASARIVWDASKAEDEAKGGGETSVSSQGLGAGSGPGSASGITSAAGAPGQPVEEAPRSQSGRKNRTAEYMRTSLRDLGEQLGARELDALLSFGEFLKQRRLARLLSAAHEHEERADSTSDVTKVLRESTKSSRETLLAGQSHLTDPFGRNDDR